MILPFGSIVVAPTDAVLASRADGGEGLLTPIERRRAAAFRHPRDRRDFVAAHVLIRLCAAHALEVPAAALTVVQRCGACRGAHGRPVLADHAEVCLSLAHTSGWVAAAAAADPVGVDVEIVTREPIDPALLDIVMTPAERSAVEAAGDPVLAFLRLWVRKEALVKLGRITLDALAHVDVSRLPEANGAGNDCCGRQAEALHVLEWCDPQREVVAAAASREQLRLLAWPLDERE